MLRRSRAFGQKWLKKLINRKYLPVWHVSCFCRGRSRGDCKRPKRRDKKSCRSISAPHGCRSNGGLSCLPLAMPNSYISANAASRFEGSVSHQAFGSIEIMADVTKEEVL